MRTVRVPCCSPATLVVLALSIVVTAHRAPAWQSRSGPLRTVTSTRVGVLCGCSSVRRTLSVTPIRDRSPTTTGPSCDGGVPYTGGGRAAVSVGAQAGREYGLTWHASGTVHSARPRLAKVRRPITVCEQGSALVHCQ